MDMAQDISKPNFQVAAAMILLTLPLWFVTSKWPQYQNHFERSGVLNNFVESSANLFISVCRESSYDSNLKTTIASLF